MTGLLKMTRMRVGLLAMLVVGIITASCVLHRVTPGGIPCVLANGDSPTAPSSHDTQWAYCRTLYLLEGFEEDRNSELLRSWLFDELKAGLFKTAWLNTYSWFLARPDVREAFESQLTVEQQRFFRDIYQKPSSL